MTLSAGSQLGPYEVRSPLGAGGMGEVYRAHDTKLNRDVALKVLPELLARDPERMARFKREAQVLASLNHPNIAAIYGFEESGSTRALVMELVEGQTLAEVVGARRAVPLQDVLPIARQIAEALEYAHERGIIHRDLKPANIKVTPEGTVKVLDFGLAKALDVESSGTSNVSTSPTLTAAATQAGVIIGTAAYMSPEQARGKAVDRRSDIWSFGCVLYETLTGRKPFEGETVTDVLAAIVRSEPDWKAIPADTPPQLIKLLQRCLDKDPKHRLRDIGEARIAIEETMSGAAVIPVVTPTPALGPPFKRSQGALLLVAGLIVGALVAGLAIWRFAAPAASRASTHFTAITNFAGVQAQPALSPDGRSVAFVSNRDGHFNIYVGLVNGGSLVQVTNDANLKSGPRWSPDGTKIAYGRLDDSGIWDIWQVPALGGTPRRVILNAGDPDWSPDGHSLVYENLAARTLWISDASGENARQVTPAEEPSVEDTEPRFSPNGRQLALIVRLGGPYGELAVADVDTGKVRRITHDESLALSPAWSHDGRSIYFASSRGGTMNIWKISAEGGEPEQITAGQGDDAQLDISADGKRIVFSTFRESLNISQLDFAAKSANGDLRPLTTDPARNQIAPVYSADGKRLAYFTNRKGAEKEGIWVSNSDGSSPLQLVQEGRINVFPRWSPDGEQLIYRSGDPNHQLSMQEYRRVSISGGAPETILKNAADLYADVNPQGQLVLFDASGKIQSYDPVSNKTQTLATPPPSKKCWLLRWSADGHSIAYVISPSRENDPDAGLWVDDFKNPPRQIFHGLVFWYARRGEEIYVLEGKADMIGVLWKVGWNGQDLTRTSLHIPLIYSYWVLPPRQPQDHFDVSPDGRRVAFNAQGLSQANIGMLENIR
ncbi:MAG TPA: protein kinase [Terriglobia bacterium]|nr:protein kinase [Terriglobia bacterium]